MTGRAAALPGASARRQAAIREFLPAALEIMETPASPAARMTSLSIGGFFVAALGWSVLGQVDIIASAPGTVIPVGKSKAVQPLDAGIVTKILVADGDHVVEGQALIELDRTQAGSERDRLAADLRQARLDVAGLSALRAGLRNGDAPEQMVLPPDLPPLAAEVEQATVLVRAREQAERIASLAQQIAGKQAEAAENAAVMARLRASLPYLEQKRDMYRALKRRQLAPVPAWADAEAAAIDQRAQIDVLAQHDVLIAAGQEALVRQLAQARATYARDILKDLRDAAQKMAELSAQYAAAQRRTDQTVLRAPVSGTVQQIAVHTIGGIVTPAQPLMTVVPDTPAMLIEAAVANGDVGFVHAGQDAEVKVEAFTFTRYGLMHGRVVDVSRDAAEARRPADSPAGWADMPGGAGDAPAASDSVYIAHIALQTDLMQIEGVSRRLEPGMRVTAEIRTGRRSVISYLLSPFDRALHDGAHER
jgi:hemolysin D